MTTVYFSSAPHGGFYASAALEYVHSHVFSQYELATKVAAPAATFHIPVNVFQRKSLQELFDTTQFDASTPYFSYPAADIGSLLHHCHQPAGQCPQQRL